MDDVRIGRVLRQLRLRKGWRQRDIAAASGISQSTVSLIERGHLATLSIRVLRGVFAAVDARFEGAVTWRGGLVDRLLDERHARLVNAVAGDLARLGWEVHIEVTFSEFGERGAIDILALRRPEGVALVVEIKSELTAVDDTVRRLDIKARLAAKIVFGRFGWRPTTIGRLLVIEEGATARRRVAAHDGILGAAFHDRGATLRAWLRRPVGGGARAAVLLIEQSPWCEIDPRVRSGLFRRHLPPGLVADDRDGVFGRRGPRGFISENDAQRRGPRRRR